MNAGLAGCNPQAPEALLESLPDLVYRLDARGHIVYLNQVIEELGYSRESLAGRHISEIIHPEDASEAILSEVLRRNPHPATPPAVLDERRTGTRMSRGLVVRIVRPNSAAHETAMLGEAVSVGLWEDRGGQRRFTGTLGVIRNVNDREARLELEKQKESLERYFSPDILRQIASAPTADHMAGQTVEATIVFMDIRNFTTISEGLAPAQVAELLNLLFNDLMDLMLSRKGSINKFMGDAILATFGCPYPVADDALNAVNAALAIRDTLRHFNRVRPRYLREDLRIGIGIASGEVFAGNIGSFRRKEYTVIGDVVNTAARLQNLTKKASVDILIDEATRQKIGEAFRCRSLSVQRLRGKEKPVRIYAVDPKQASESPAGLVTLFRQAG
ncbi:MAG: PAS domain S-box protein [Leptospirales bacterium]|nr:PAS domain S-box protein [Leptospirales bacterium]